MKNIAVFGAAYRLEQVHLLADAAAQSFAGRQVVRL